MRLRTYLLGLVLLLSSSASAYAAGPVSSTAAAPALTEGSANSFSGDLLGNIRTTLGTLLACEDQTNNLCMVSGGAVRQTTVTSAVTTNTTSTAIAVPTGSKTFYGQVVGTGSVTQTQAIYGDIDNDAANGILLCTLTLSGTTRTQDACPVVTANFSYYYVITTATTGTSATGAVYAMY